MTGAAFYTWSDYFIPGTTVLRNKFTSPGAPYGIEDQDQLQRLEEKAALIRMAELAQHPVDGRFDYAHMKAIHYHIFQDVYEWAGQERTAPDTHMTKSYPDVVNFEPGDPEAPWRTYRYYPAGETLTAAAEQQYELIRHQDYFRGMPRDAFVKSLAESWGEINTIHSFREGNTRSQFMFYTQLCEQAGWSLDPRRFTTGHALREEFLAARFYSQATGSNTRLEMVLRKVVTPLREHLPGITETPRLTEASCPMPHSLPPHGRKLQSGYGYGRGAL